ncbi:YfgJ family double zinc ribbon protein [Anaeromicrobium sediminis]|uniref:Replication restart DNA helicase PriA n=1 Tax=Anaeromicrobium sediminis TaxID=1478221 RepID=A0A267MEN2_9FIRM|nr:zinc-ribbon domain-containing protein [Anaeromicrobium sediminis]PAB57852.1 hypothetical protein CCE28_17790 [Anaeromicrobium sediminis]
MKCIECGGNMKGRGSRFSCEKCHIDYEIKFKCEKCGSKPDELSSCAAINYFCPTCKELKSREKMDKAFIKI